MDRMSDVINQLAVSVQAISASGSNVGDQQSMWQAPTAGRGGHADASADAASVASAGTCRAADIHEADPLQQRERWADACATRGMGRRMRSSNAMGRLPTQGATGATVA